MVSEVDSRVSDNEGQGGGAKTHQRLPPFVSVFDDAKEDEEDVVSGEKPDELRVG